jgi:hypothetical protein
MFLARIALAGMVILARRPWDPRLLWATLALIGVILLGALLIVVLDRWRRRLDEEPCSTANDQLAAFRTMFERGEMSQEEFERIRAHLGGQLREELDVKVAPPADVPSNGTAPPPTDGPQKPR